MRLLRTFLRLKFNRKNYLMNAATTIPAREIRQLQKNCAFFRAMSSKYQ